MGPFPGTGIKKGLSAGATDGSVEASVIDKVVVFATISAQAERSNADKNNMTKSCLLVFISDFDTVFGSYSCFRSFGFGQILF